MSPHGRLSIGLECRLTRHRVVDTGERCGDRIAHLGVLVIGAVGFERDDAARLRGGFGVCADLGGADGDHPLGDGIEAADPGDHEGHNESEQRQPGQMFPRLVLFRNAIAPHPVRTLRRVHTLQNIFVWTKRVRNGEGSRLIRWWR